MDGLIGAERSGPGSAGTGPAGTGRPPIHSERLDRRQLRLILGLRWKLFVRDARSKPLLFALRMVVALGLLIGGLMGGVALAFGVHSFLVDGTPTRAVAAVHLAYLFAFLWLGLGPLLAFRANEFLDVTKLFVLPVSHRTVFAGSLIGACLSPATFIASVPVFATSLAFGGGPVDLALRVVAGVGILTCSVATGEVVKLLMLNVLRSRIWRDVMLIVGPLIAAGFFLFWQFVFNGGENGIDIGALLERVKPLIDQLLFLPSWWGASAASSGDLSGWLPVLVPIVLTFVLIRVAAGLQRQAYHGEVAAPVSVGARSKSRRSPFWFLPDPIRALAEKDVKLLFREPIVRMLLIQQGAFALFPVGLTLFRILSEDAASAAEARFIDALPFVPLVALLMLVMEIALLLNLLGLEGGGIAHTLLTPVRGAQILWGKVAAHLWAFGTLNALVGMVVALLVFFWAGEPFEAIWRSLLAAAMAYIATAVALSITVVASVYLPIRLATRDRKALRQQAGGKEGCLAALKNLMTMGFVGCAVLPLVVLVYAADVAQVIGVGESVAAWLPVVRVCGLATAAIVAVFALRAGVGIAGKALENRVEAVIERLARSDD